MIYSEFNNLFLKSGKFLPNSKQKRTFRRLSADCPRTKESENKGLHFCVRFAIIYSLSIVQLFCRLGGATKTDAPMPERPFFLSVLFEPDRNGKAAVKIKRFV